MKDLKYVTLQSYQLHSLSDGRSEARALWPERCPQCNLLLQHVLLFQIPSSHSTLAATDTGLRHSTKTLGAKKVISGEVPSAVIISKYLLNTEEPEARGSLILL